MRPAWSALVAVVIAALGTTAHAGRYKVLIESEPPGATVYFGDTESTPVCTATPCTVDVPATETVVYIQLKNFTPEMDSVDPAKKAQRIKKILKPAVGRLIIEGAKGARVQIEDEDKGKAPEKYELGEGTYHVVVTAPAGKVLYDDIVEVKAGEDNTITPIATTVASGGGGGDPGDGPTDGPSITKPAGPRTHDRYFLASVAADVGFRNFTYDNNTTRDTLLEDQEGGQVMVGPMVEVWPMEILGVPQLPGLSLVGRYLYNVNSQAVSTVAGLPTSLTTFWQNVEASVRYRWTVAELVGVEVSGGYNRDTRRFNGNQSDIDKVPDADYQSLRLGARISVMVGKLEPYLTGENRIVFSGGNLGNRFPLGENVSGLHGAIGVGARMGPLGIRLEAGVTRYTWTFKAASDGMRVATGATDAMSQISLAVGYAY